MLEADRIQFRYSVIAIASNIVLKFLDQAGDVTEYGARVSKMNPLWYRKSIQGRCL